MSVVSARNRSMVIARLGPGERRTGARVDAVAEPDVLAAVHAVEAELERVVELARVAVGGAVQHEHAGARRAGRPRPPSPAPSTAGTRP